MPEGSKKRRRPAEESSYACPSCGEQIVIPVELSDGNEQEFIEDCPVCCNPNVIHVDFSGDDELPRVWAEAE